MSTTKTLIERLSAHPELVKRISKLIDMVEAESGHFDRADEAEEAVIHHLIEMGNELLKDWGTYKENQQFEDIHYLHPRAKVQKNTYWTPTAKSALQSGA